MTRPDCLRRCAFLALLSLLIACGDGELAPRTSSPVVALPPPILGTGVAKESGPISAVDADDWVLPDPAQDVAGPPWLRMVVSQDNRAELAPCGCPGSPSGGMGKRTTLIRTLRTLVPGVLVLEGPTSLSRAVLGIEQVGGEERRRARTVLDALALSRPTAFFPGQADLEVLPLRELSARAAALGLPLIATNLAPGTPGVQDRLVVERGGRRALLLGLIGAPRSAEQADAVPLVDAPAAVARILSDEASRGTVDLVVLFTDAENRELTGWREASLDVDIWFVPPGIRRAGRYTREPDRLIVRAEPLGRAFRRVDVAFSGPEGRGLVEGDEFALIELAKAERQHVQQTVERRAALMDGAADAALAELQRGLAEAKHRRGVSLRRANGPTKGHRVAVTDLLIHPDLPMDGQVVAVLEAFNEDRLGALAATMAANPQAPRGRTFEGMDTCTECHAAEFAQWGRSPHASAWKTLRDAGQTRNPDCLGCHTTGFAEPGGWIDPRQPTALFNVQCEACHGPMDLHTSQAQKRAVKADPGVPVTEATCVRCHDPANSPKFDFHEYARSVAHVVPEDE